MKISSKLHLRISTAGLLIGLLGSSLAVSGERPNVVIILADDLGIGDVSAYNENSAWQTPHIDRLASQGMSFSDAHTSSALCTPTRYGILT
ncbi:MAG: sulfatase-like hydrolase/transferase, partial [Verrucomicrobiia bacterium]